MAKPDAKKWPLLKKAWDEYGHMIAWEDLVDMKSDGNWAYMAWDDDGEIQYADLYRTKDGWEFNNDGGDPVPKAVWKKAHFSEGRDGLFFG
jgi:hypothetical protein